MSIEEEQDFETFTSVNSYQVGSLKSDSPTCSNGVVRVAKYRVRVEPVDEPVEVIQARIQKLWDECDNSHHWGPLQAAAAKYGMPRLTHP